MQLCFDNWAVGTSQLYWPESDTTTRAPPRWPSVTVFLLLCLSVCVVGILWSVIETCAVYPDIQGEAVVERTVGRGEDWEDSWFPTFKWATWKNTILLFEKPPRPVNSRRWIEPLCSEWPVIDTVGTGPDLYQFSFIVQQTFTIVILQTWHIFLLICPS